MTCLAKDSMSAKIESIAPDMNAKEALRVLLTSGRSGLPVLDKDGAVVGVFTEKEALSAILPGYVKDVGSFIYGDDSKAAMKKFSHLDGHVVSDLMRTEVPTVTEDTPLAEVSRIMLTRNERRIIVVRGAKAVGVLTRHDIVKALAEKCGMKF